MFCVFFFPFKSPSHLTGSSPIVLGCNPLRPQQACDVSWSTWALSGGEGLKAEVGAGGEASCVLLSAMLFGGSLFLKSGTGG